MPAISFPTRDDHVPWPREALMLVTAGQTRAAGDLAWLRLVQLLGDRRYAEAHHPHLEDWLATVVDLNPDLMTVYYLGVIYLAADPERSDEADRLLARGEQRWPDEFRLPLLRGSAAYFGRFDLEAAAGHYARAAALPNAPPYVARLATRLRESAQDCRRVADDVQATAGLGTGVQRRLMLEQTADIVVRCTRMQIEQAAAQFRLQNDDADVTVDRLVGLGRLPPPWSPPGLCWVLRGPDAELTPCP